MKLLHVITSFGMGGAERVATLLATECAHRHDVRVVGIFDVEPAHEPIRRETLRRLEAAGVRGIELGLRRKGPEAVNALARLHGAIRTFDPDIVHSHTDIPDLFVSLVRRTARFPQARTIHNTVLWPGRTLLPRLVEARFRDDLVVAVGEGAKAAYLALRNRLGLAPSPFLHVVPNGIGAPDDDPPLSEGAAAASLGASPSRTRLGFVGRLDRQKGLDLLLEALHRLDAGERQQIELHVIGDGPEREALERRGAGLPLIFHGPKAEARRLMLAFDLLVVPSRYEGFLPLVALEAQMAGLPMLISDAPGIREAPKTLGQLRYPADDTSALAAGLRHCLQTLPELKAAARAAAPVAIRDYSAERMTRAHEALYARYLSDRGGGRP